MTPPTAVVIVPAFNERDGLPILAAALMRRPNVSLLVGRSNTAHPKIC